MRSSRARADVPALGLRRAAVVASLSLVAAGSAHAAGFEVTSVAWLPTRPAQLEIGLAGALPPDEVLSDVRRWTVRRVNLRDGSEAALRPTHVDVARPLELVTLVLSEALLPFDESGDLAEVTVRYFKDPGFAEGRVRSRAERLVFVGARGQGEADVFLSGAFAVARGAKATYSGEVKLRASSVKPSGAALSASFALAAANEANIDPDSITAALSYRPGRRLLGGHADWSVLSGEFARRTEVRNLASGARLTWATSTLGRGTAHQATLEPFVGFEAGRNLTRREVSGDRAVFRPLLGANLYLLSLQPAAALNRITVGAEFTLRLPRTEEPYTERRHGQAVTSLSRRARAHVGANLVFQFIEGYGVAVEYRHGSLPPAFERVEHRLALSLTVQRKRR